MPPVWIRVILSDKIWDEPAYPSSDGPLVHTERVHLGHVKRI